MKYLIIGLGNPGKEYIGTRHNIGADFIDYLCNKKELNQATERYGIYSKYQYRGRTIHLLKPSTYMNHSGKSIKYWINKLNVKIENTLVIYDDLALPFNKIRIKPQGSSAGHNGLKSIEENLGTSNYPRLKFGIGNNYQKGAQSDYVLDQFNDDEKKCIKQSMEKIIEIIQSFVFNGIINTMTKYN